jgi:hypothetical protein
MACQRLSVGGRHTTGRVTPVGGLIAPECFALPYYWAGGHPEWPDSTKCFSVSILLGGPGLGAWAVSP